TAGPGESHAFTRKRLEGRPPLRDVRIVSAQIWNFRRNGCRLGLERQWQTAERAIDIVSGQGLAARVARSNAVDGGEQRVQFGWHVEQDRRTGARQKGGIADELNAVAQALFGRQQDRALSKGKFAQPEPATITAAGIGHTGAFPAPLVFRKAAG